MATPGISFGNNHNFAVQDGNKIRPATAAEKLTKIKETYGAAEAALWKKYNGKMPAGGFSPADLTNSGFPPAVATQASYYSNLAAAPGLVPETYSYPDISGGPPDTLAEGAANVAGYLAADREAGVARNVSRRDAVLGGYDALIANNRAMMNQAATRQDAERTQLLNDLQTGYGNRASAISGQYGADTAALMNAYGADRSGLTSRLDSAQAGAASGYGADRTAIANQFATDASGLRSGLSRDQSSALANLDAAQANVGGGFTADRAGIMGRLNTAQQNALQSYNADRGAIGGQFDAASSKLDRDLNASQKQASSRYEADRRATTSRFDADTTKLLSELALNQTKALTDYKGDRKAVKSQVDKERSDIMSQLAKKQGVSLATLRADLKNAESTLGQGFNQAIGEARQRLSRNMGYVDQMGASQKEKLERQLIVNRAKAAQSAQNRGMRNTTVTDALQRGVTSDYDLASLELADALLRNKVSTDSALSGDVVNLLAARGRELGGMEAANANSYAQLGQRQAEYGSQLGSGLMQFAANLESGMANNQASLAQQQAQNMASARGGASQFGANLRSGSDATAANLAQQQAQYAASFGGGLAQYGAGLKSGMADRYASLGQQQAQNAANTDANLSQFGSTLTRDLASNRASLAQQQAQNTAQFGAGLSQYGAGMNSNAAQYATNLAQQQGQNAAQYGAGLLQYGTTFGGNVADRSAQLAGGLTGDTLSATSAYAIQSAAARNAREAANAATENTLSGNRLGFLASYTDDYPTVADISGAYLQSSTAKEASAANKRAQNLAGGGVHYSF